MMQEAFCWLAERAVFLWDRAQARILQMTECASVILLRRAFRRYRPAYGGQDGGQVARTCRP